MPPTSTPRWEIKDDSKNVKLTLFNMPEGAMPGDFQVAIEDDVLVIKTKPKLPVEQQAVPDGSISFHIRLLVPKGYDKENVRAELRALVVTIPKINPAFTKEVAIDGK
jgi:HSP20 family molecular chaperone IbpA